MSGYREGGYEPAHERQCYMQKEAGHLHVWSARLCRLQRCRLLLAPRLLLSMLEEPALQLQYHILSAIVCREPLAGHPV